MEDVVEQFNMYAWRNPNEQRFSAQLEEVGFTELKRIRIPTIGRIREERNRYIIAYSAPVETEYQLVG